MDKPHTRQEPPSEMNMLRRHLVTLYDELAEFTDQCSFLCDAFSSIYAQKEVIDDETISGMSYYTHWMKRRIWKIKADLKAVHKQANAIK